MRVILFKSRFLNTILFNASVTTIKAVDGDEDIPAVGIRQILVESCAKVLIEL